MKIVTDKTAFYIENGPWIKIINNYFRSEHVKLYRPVSCNGITRFGIIPDAMPTLEKFCEKYSIELVSVPMSEVYYRGKKFEKLMSMMR